MRLDLLDTLRDLVAIPSVNPMGRPVSGSPFLETALTDHLEGLFQRLGLAVERQTVAPGRDNLLARLEGDVAPERGGAVLLFDAHQDTVPADHMVIDPWTPLTRDGRLHGRGACDVKGGMAAMLGAIARLADERPPNMPTIVMACTVDEEYRLSGARALAGRIRPDAAIIAEPTGLDVIVAHKGVVRWQCHTRGRAAHSSNPAAGESAIYAMARVIAALEAYEHTVLPRLGGHPLCGAATLNVGTIRGGSSINIVPDLCTIEVELRLAPGGNPEAARLGLIGYLAREARLDPSAHDPPYMQGPPLGDGNNGLLADRLAAAATEVVGQCRRCGVPYATDAAYVGGAGAPAVVFGPGSIEQAHTDNEWIAIDQVEQAAEILYRLAKSWNAPPTAGATSSNAAKASSRAANSSSCPDQSH